MRLLFSIVRNVISVSSVMSQVTKTFKNSENSPKVVKIVKKCQKNCQNCKSCQNCQSCQQLSKCWSGHVSPSLWSNVSMFNSVRKFPKRISLGYVSEISDHRFEDGWKRNGGSPPGNLQGGDLDLLHSGHQPRREGGGQVPHVLDESFSTFQERFFRCNPSC